VLRRLARAGTANTASHLAGAAHDRAGPRTASDPASGGHAGALDAADDPAAGDAVAVAPDDQRPPLLRRRVQRGEPLLPGHRLQHERALRPRCLPRVRRPGLRARLRHVHGAVRPDPLLSHGVRDRPRLLHGRVVPQHVGGAAVRPNGVRRVHRPGAHVQRRGGLRAGVQRAAVL
jgi:hypothetical protein